MQQFKFIIPQKLEDLLHPQEDPNIFYVNDELTSLEIAQKLPESETNLKQDPLSLTDEFYVFFSVLKGFNTLDSRIIDRTWQMMLKTTDSFRDQLREIFSVLNDSLASQSFNVSQNGDPLSQNSLLQQENRGNLFESLQEKLRFLNTLKMLIYINCTFVQLFEDALASQNHRQNFNETYSESATPAVKRKKKQRVIDDSGQGPSFKEYDRYKERVMKNLLQLISMPLNKISDSPTEARDICAQAMRVCYKMIENSSINNLAKNKDLLNINFSLLGYGVEKYNQSLSFCLKFIQLLQYREQLAPLLAELVEYIVTRHEQRLLIGELLREIDRIDIKDLSRDSSCPRAVSTFLVELSEKCPNEFLPSLNHVFEYLEQDSYIMRNASLAILANTVIKVLFEKEDERSLRDEILDVLLAHIKDITGYSRSKALAIWTQLCEAKCIPLSYLVPVTSAAVGRLQDKSCFVRKSAVKFIISILSRNPFALKLPLDAFLERYEVEKKKLVELEEEEKKKMERQEEVLDRLSQHEEDEPEAGDVEMASGDATMIGQQGDINTSCMRVKNLALAEESVVVTQRRKVNYLADAIAFTRQIHKAIPLTTEMLSSKNITDIQEAIDFFVNCHEFGIDEALIGFKRMIMLINVQEKSVKDAISLAYTKIFFESSRYEGKSNLDSLVVSNFMNFVQDATVGECIALENLLGQFLQSKHLTKDMERELWARFTRAKSNTSLEESVLAIQILGLLAAHKPDLINHNLNLCVEYGLACEGNSELESRLVRETCIAIRKSLPKKIEDKRRTLRLAKDDELFRRLADIIVNSLDNAACKHWFSMCDEAVRIVFDCAENPELIAESIHGRLVERLLKNAVPAASFLGSQDTQRNETPDLVFQPASLHGGSGSNTASTTPAPSSTPAPGNAELVHPMALARFIHFLGDVALDLAVFLEMHVLLELKLRSVSGGGGGGGSGAGELSVNNISAHNISVSARRRSRRFQANKSMDEANLEEEIGLGGAEAEDAEMEFIGSICDEELVCGKHLLAKLSRVIVEVVTDPFRFPQPELKQASSLALAKYMMVSARYCHDHLRLLFTILEKTKDAEIKINLLIAISDLCIRFPNQLDGWTGKIFDCLQHEQVAVRRAALKILSRLVLCDILKAKDQISTMANLIVDQDEQIASYSRHFFLELSKKLNAIYNILPDIISRLSDAKTGTSEENFRIVMKFLFDLIDKSQHIDRLVDKLCGRFMDTDNERHWSDLAYCLSLLKYSDKSMVKLYDKFDCYKDKLCIDSVRDSIGLAVANYKKTPHLKNELRQMLDEFEAKMAKCVGEAPAAEAPAGGSPEVSVETEPEPEPGQVDSSADSAAMDAETEPEPEPARRPARKGARAAPEVHMDTEPEPEPPTPAKASSRRPQRRANARRGRSARAQSESESE